MAEFKPDFLELVNRAQSDGWAAGRTNIVLMQNYMRIQGWKEVPHRAGAPALADLRPTPRESAPPRSLSAKVGLAEQPLHTDGAHLRVPPDIVILSCEEPSPTPTLLWRPGRSSAGRPLGRPEHLRHGVFLVMSGAESFFATMEDDRNRIRYDPGCMIPCDERARKTVEYVSENADSAEIHEWREPGTVLVINNRKVLHARADATDDTERLIQRVNFRAPRGES